MRDNHEQLPEILNAIEQDGHYFCVISLELSEQKKFFRFGINQDGYLAIKRILQLRPFDQMPGTHYRYFFVPSVRRLENDKVMMTVRVEQDHNGKQTDIEAPRDLFANLKWFFELDDWTKAEHLTVPSPNARHKYLHYRKSIMELLTAIAALDSRLGPVEICCGWFDDLYLPACKNIEIYNPGVWERGMLEWKACFSDHELNTLTKFHTVFAGENKKLSMEQPDRWKNDARWVKVSKAAQLALSELKSKVDNSF